MERLGKFVDYNPKDKTTCEYCNVYREQPYGIEPGATTDTGWWCQVCIGRGHRRTNAQIEWMLFAEDYPQFALELKRLRKQASG